MIDLQSAVMPHMKLEGSGKCLAQVRFSGFLQSSTGVGKKEMSCVFVYAFTSL